ncbi:MAG: MarR family transcriptional regulator [Chitinophagaceae bacterium]|nr:MarR family transcriptional regulator [Chitinophagaceae bacterium]
MSIEQELNRQFRNQNHKVTVNIHYSGLWVQEKMNAMLANYQLTNQQYNMLRILGRAEEPFSTLQLRKHMMDKMSDTSRIVDRLVIKGLVKKTTSKKDRRLVDVVLSQKGKDLIKKLERELDNKVDKLTSKLSPKEALQLNILLDKMRS